MSKRFDSDDFTLSICFAAISIGYQNDRPIVRIASRRRAFYVTESVFIRQWEVVYRE